jgi:hypothetical protein
MVQLVLTVPQVLRGSRAYKALKENREIQVAKVQQVRVVLKV